MRIVAAQELENWLTTGKVLEKDPRGAKVVALNNGLFLKIFHTRRHPLLARLQPAARRFATNAGRLIQLGVPAPEVREVFWLNRDTGLSACIYTPLPGQSIEQLYRQAPEQVEDFLVPLAAFIRRLHRQGIYFRSLHLGNILRLPNDAYGLIDILDLQIKRRPLNPWLVRRNFQHLQHYLSRSKLANFPYESLLKHYQSAAHR